MAVPGWIKDQMKDQEFSKIKESDRQKKKAQQRMDLNLSTSSATPAPAIRAQPNTESHAPPSRPLPKPPAPKPSTSHHEEGRKQRNAAIKSGGGMDVLDLYGLGANEAPAKSQYGAFQLKPKAKAKPTSKPKPTTPNSHGGIDVNVGPDEMDGMAYVRHLVEETKKEVVRACVDAALRKIMSTESPVRSESQYASSDEETSEQEKHIRAGSGALGLLGAYASGSDSGSDSDNGSKPKGSPLQSESRKIEAMHANVDHGQTNGADGGIDADTPRASVAAATRMTGAARALERGSATTTASSVVAPAPSPTNMVFIRASAAPSTLPVDQRAEEKERAKHVLKQWMHTPSSSTPLLNPNRIQLEVYQRGEFKFTSVLQKCTTIVGREPGAYVGERAASLHVKVPFAENDPISRCHVLLVIDVAGKMHVIDKSLNGTLLNRRKLSRHTPQRLKLNDRIQLDPVELIVTHGGGNAELQCIDERGRVVSGSADAIESAVQAKTDAAGTGEGGMGSTLRTAKAKQERGPTDTGEEDGAQAFPNTVATKEQRSNGQHAHSRDDLSLLEHGDDNGGGGGKRKRSRSRSVNPGHRYRRSRHRERNRSRDRSRSRSRSHSRSRSRSRSRGKRSDRSRGRDRDRGRSRSRSRSRDRSRERSRDRSRERGRGSRGRSRDHGRGRKRSRSRSHSRVRRSRSRGGGRGRGRSRDRSRSRSRSRSRRSRTRTRSRSRDSRRRR